MKYFKIITIKDTTRDCSNESIFIIFEMKIVNCFPLKMLVNYERKVVLNLFVEMTSNRMAQKISIIHALVLKNAIPPHRHKSNILLPTLIKLLKR